MSEPIKRIKTPVKLHFSVPAGHVLSKFLAGVLEGKLLGRRCPECTKVYVPARGSCPSCGVVLAEEVAVKDTGMITSFCVVNVPYEGQTMKLPYVYASIVLDGSDIPFPHLIDAEPADVRMGMRVQAVWAPPEKRTPSLESILCFKPTGEPDAPFDAYKDHL